jgi:transcriptional regulator GlxA family with amidase domain
VDEGNPLTHPAAEDPRILEVVAHIRAHCDQPLTTEELARLAHLSTGRFAHLFRSITGETPHRFVNTVRLSRAREMLPTTDETLNTIAQACGFCSEFYLSNVFQEHYGVRPNQLRRENRLSDSP